MKKNNIRKIAMLIALSQALTFTECKNTVALNDEDKENYEYNVSNGCHVEDGYCIPDGYHLEKNKVVKDSIENDTSNVLKFK